MNVQLGPKLALRAGGVDGTKAVLQNRRRAGKQRVVVDDVCRGRRGLADASPSAAGDLATCSSRKSNGPIELASSA